MQRNHRGQHEFDVRAELFKAAIASKVFQCQGAKPASRDGEAIRAELVPR